MDKYIIIWYWDMKEQEEYSTVEGYYEFLDSEG